MEGYKLYAKENCSGISLTEFWRNAEFPKLARKAQIYLFVVTNSMDAERSFSSYGHIFTEQRQSTKEDRFNQLTMLTFNSKI
ncbi:UNVERIFIED_CONTAM: hypothetical protein FKN15_078499 [Acipenser sinensis]